jgi:hypothetical protein
MDFIDWAAHGRSLQRNISMRCHFTKVVHDILPTNSLVSKYSPGIRSAKCPCCPHLCEDRDHVIRCPHSTRRTWRRQCLIAIRKRCDQLSTRPYLTEILLGALEAWFADSELRMPNLPTLYNRLLYEQKAIGWRQVFNGRFSNEWAVLQDDYLHQQRKHKGRHDGLNWTTSITCEIWKQWRVLWEMRNQVIHGRNLAEQATIQRRTAISELRAIYLLREEMLPGDRCILMATVEQHAEKPTLILKNWIHTFKPTVIHSVKIATQSALRGVRSLTEYFRPLR